MSTATACPPRGPRARRRASPGVALFDLDRTLLPGSSLMDLGRALADRKVIDRSTVARHAMKAAMFSRRGLPDARIDRLRESLLSAAADHDQDEIAAVAREVGPEIALSAHPAARWLIERHHKAGDVCVVVSASPQELVEVIGAALGADRAIGTRTEVVDGRFTGRLDGPFCHGAGKLARLEAEMNTGADPRWTSDQRFFRQEGPVSGPRRRMNTGRAPAGGQPALLPAGGQPALRPAHRARN